VSETYRRRLVIALVVAWHAFGMFLVYLFRRNV